MEDIQQEARITRPQLHTNKETYHEVFTELFQELNMQLSPQTRSNDKNLLELLLRVQNLLFLYFHLNQLKYFRVSNLYIEYFKNVAAL